MRREHNESDNVELILTIVGGLTFFYIIRFSQYPKNSQWHYLLLLPLIVAGIGLFNERGRSKIVAFWIKLGLVLGKVMPKIIFGTMFWLVLVPLSLLYKVFGSTNKVFEKPQTSSFYVVRNIIFGAKDLENPW